MSKKSPFVDIIETTNDDGLDDYRIGAGDDYLNGDSKYVISDNTLVPSDNKSKRGRPRKTDNSVVVERPINGDIRSNPNNTGVDYHSAYQETDLILKTAIGQTDMLINEVGADLAKIRESKAMTSKYKYITDLSLAMSGLISTKISAAKELNNSISKANDMEYKMNKELKALEVNKDDNKSIMDLYNAFISAPVSSRAILGPSIQDMTLPKNTNISTMDIITANMNSNQQDEFGYQQYLANMTPEQNRMRYENNPNVQTVVVYDQSSGQKWFDVIDTQTGQSIPNMPKPDEFLLDDTRPDLMNMVARNSNINVTYPLRVVGEKSSLYDY